MKLTQKIGMLLAATGIAAGSVFYATQDCSAKTSDPVPSIEEVIGCGNLLIPCSNNKCWDYCSRHARANDGKLISGYKISGGKQCQCVYKPKEHKKTVRCENLVLSCSEDDCATHCNNSVDGTVTDSNASADGKRCTCTYIPRR